jgi:SAM-dependent methyltransferase
MGLAWDIVKRVNAAAQASGSAASVLQFDNLGTQSQYRTPYLLTRQYIRSGDRVLDWGCGNGHFSVFLESLGADVTGYSFEPPPQVMASSPRFRFVAGSESDPRTLPVPDASFDAAVGMGVLEHVWETGGDEPSSLRELARVVKPGGTLLVFHFPNETGWIESVVAGLGLKKHLHGRRYGRAQIDALWKEAGLSIIDVGVYNALPRAELRALPGVVKHSDAFARAYNLIDDTISRVAPRICTNYFVIARTDA